MNGSAKCAVVIPCLNEARRIAETVRGARKFIETVLVIDDGSSDSTAHLAHRAGAQVLGHHRPQGKGVALGTGFRAAWDQGFEWALAMDGDGQHAPADIPRFLTEPGRGNPHMIIGNRLQNPTGMPFVRHQVNRWMSKKLGTFCGFKVPDSQCGFRLVHLPAWRTLSFSARYFEIESELLVRFAAAGFTIRSVPVQTAYGEEESKVRPFRDTVRWLAWWRSIQRELSPHPHDRCQSEALAPQTTGSVRCAAPGNA